MQLDAGDLDESADGFVVAADRQIVKAGHSSGTSDRLAAFIEESVWASGRYRRMVRQILAAADRRTRVANNRPGSGCRLGEARSHLVRRCPCVENPGCPDRGVAHVRRVVDVDVAFSRLDFRIAKVRLLTRKKEIDAGTRYRSRSGRRALRHRARRTGRRLRSAAPGERCNGHAARKRVATKTQNPHPLPP